MRFPGYERRDRSLKILGFASYAEYLASPMWQELRLRALRRDRFSCRCCGNRATQVHHKEYTATTMRGQNLGELLSVCGDCHREMEFNGSRKVGVSRANGRAKMLRKRNGISRRGFPVKPPNDSPASPKSFATRDM